MSITGLFTSLQTVPDSPYAPLLRTVHLFPLAVILIAGVGSLGRILLSHSLSIPLPAATTTTIGIAGLVTGLCIALLPLVLSCVAQCSTWIHAHFVLSNWPLRFVQLVLLLLLCAMPLIGLGYTGHLLHVQSHDNVERKESRNRVAPAPGVLTGLSAGFLLAALLAPVPASLLPAASLPMLVLAMFAGKLFDPTAVADPSKPTSLQHPSDR